MEDEQEKSAVSKMLGYLSIKTTKIVVKLFPKVLKHWQDRAQKKVDLLEEKKKQLEIKIERQAKIEELKKRKEELKADIAKLKKTLNSDIPMESKDKLKEEISKKYNIQKSQGIDFVNTNKSKEVSQDINKPVEIKTEQPKSFKVNEKVNLKGTIDDIKIFNNKDSVSISDIRASNSNDKTFKIFMELKNKGYIDFAEDKSHFGDSTFKLNTNGKPMLDMINSIPSDNMKNIYYKPSIQIENLLNTKIGKETFDNLMKLKDNNFINFNQDNKHFEKSTFEINPETQKLMSNILKIDSINKSNNIDGIVDLKKTGLEKYGIDMIQTNEGDLIFATKNGDMSTISNEEHDINKALNKAFKSMGLNEKAIAECMGDKKISEHILNADKDKKVSKELQKDNKKNKQKKKKQVKKLVKKAITMGL